jgi:hypothetical protein
MLIALIAVIIGIFFSMAAADSIFIIIAGKIFILGAFIIGVTAFLLFLKEWFFGYWD